MQPIFYRQFLGISPTFTTNVFPFFNVTRHQIENPI